MMQSSLPIGIDLGTSLTGAAVYRNGKCEMIPNMRGDKLTPSYIFYHPDSLEVSVGITADQLGVSNIDNFLFDIKRFIGRKFDDAYVQNLKNFDDYRFKIVRGDQGQTEIEVRYDGLLVRKSLEEICSEILKNMKESASEYLGAPVTEAVISVPAYFSNAQRKATKAAAELSGLTVLKLITEPVAAAIHYAQDRLNTNSTLLVFDFGGGTLDVSVIDVNGSLFAVKSVEGDSFFGGRDFDQMLLNYFKSQIQERLKLNALDYRLLRRIQRKCEELKKSLSFRPSHSIELHGFGEDANSITLMMNRQQFNTLIEDSVERALGIMTKCLNGAGLTKEDITDVLLVGGSTRIPKIREKLKSLFGVNKIRTNLNPDEAVALGAGIQAAVFKKEFKELEKYEIKEITPLSLGLGQTNNLMKIIIDKNSTLPKKGTGTFRTLENNVTSVTFCIYEGARKNIKYNNLLGRFTIHNLPPGKAGDIKFEVVFNLDEDGILEVSAREMFTGKHKKLIVTLGEFRFCDHEIRQRIENAEQNKKDDELFESFVHYLWKVRRVCNNVLYDLNKITSTSNRTFVKSKCDDLLHNMKQIEYTKLDVLKRVYADFKASISPLIDYADIQW